MKGFAQAGLWWRQLRRRPDHRPGSTWAPRGHAWSTPWHLTIEILTPEGCFANVAGAALALLNCRLKFARKARVAQAAARHAIYDDLRQCGPAKPAAERIPIFAGPGLHTLQDALKVQRTIRVEPRPFAGALDAYIRSMLIAPAPAQNDSRGGSV